jgi:plasmid stabilization system protein ParE
MKAELAAYARAHGGRLSCTDLNETRKFRHVATHTYDDFNWADAKRPVEAARVIAASLADVLREFQQRLDPRSK